MNLTQSSLLFVLALALCRQAMDAPVQDDPPPLPLPDARVEPSQQDLLLPGVLPQGTTEVAKARWLALTEATLVQGVERQPVRSFRLPFDMRVLRDQTETHDVHATYSFLAPNGYVRFTLESGRENLRGPEGDFSLTSEGKSIRLEGREYKEDRRQIDEAVRIAKNFVALTDPGSLRIQHLSVSTRPPVGLPDNLVALASKLEWLEVISPDFHLYRSSDSVNNENRFFRVLLGLDAKTHRIELAELREVGNTRTAPILIRFDKYLPLDGFQIPHKLQFFELAPNSRPRVFQDKPTSDLVLLKNRGTLRADLKPEDFKPAP